MNTEYFNDSLLFCGGLATGGLGRAGFLIQTHNPMPGPHAGASLLLESQAQHSHRVGGESMTECRAGMVKG